MRISDWSSDVCSSDLLATALGLQRRQLDIEQVAGVEDRQRERTGPGERCRQVDVQALAVRVAVAARVARPDAVAALLRVVSGNIGRAAEAQRTAVAVLAGRAVDAELGTQLARERLGRDHDPRDRK